jgi:hypothetical protein
MTDLVDIGSRRELFVDHHLIESMRGLALQMHRPTPSNVALACDRPWEGLHSGCGTVLFDGGRYLMYYRGLPTSPRDGATRECTCLATSRDGVDFQRPSLGLYVYDGIKDNNIMLLGMPEASHNFDPFIDTRPGVPEEQRFKAIAGVHKSGLMAYASADGVHWRKLQEAPILTSESFAFDSQNVGFWSAHEGCYVMYFRTWRERTRKGSGIRWISRATSEDFLHWSPPVEMETTGRPYEQLYTQGTQPYFRAPHIYVALGARFWPKKEVMDEEQARSVGIDPRYAHDISDAYLATSRGGNTYDRTFMESFIRPGPGLNNWASRANYPGVGVVPTGEREMSFYVRRHNASPSSHMGRYAMRLDGFASLSAGYEGGECLSRPLRFTGARLEINYETSAAGEIRVQIEDSNGLPLDGYAFAQCRPLVGDDIERPVSWQGGPDVSILAGRSVRLRFRMNDADLYALQFCGKR